MEAIIEKKKVRYKGGKIKANARRKAALKRLEEHYEVFVGSYGWGDLMVVQNSMYTHGGKKLHKGRSFEAECRRLKAEITNLKAHII